MQGGTHKTEPTGLLGGEVGLEKLSYGKSVTYMNDGTSLKSVSQIIQLDNLQSIIWVTLENGLIKYSI